MKPIIADKPISELRPFDVKCSDTNCQQGFHYYTSKVAPKGGKVGDCKKCGDSSVDWDRIYRREPGDIHYTFECLKKELLRHVCWVNYVEDSAIERAKKRGKTAILKRAKEIIATKIGHPIRTFWDKKCTPKKGNEIINYAQHATATCCRICLDRWHNIPQNVDLNEDQIDYCVALIEKFIDDRLPDLNEEPDTTIKKKSKNG